MAEEEFRRLQAELEAYADTEGRAVALPKITVCGRSWPLKTDGGLIQLLRYVTVSSHPPTAEDATEAAQRKAEIAGQQQQMAAMHQLLEECMAPEHFREFEQHVTKAKATNEDLGPALETLISVYTARPYWPGLRLLATVAGRLAELDGAVLKTTGRSLATFTAREVCNLMLTQLFEGKDDEERQIILEDLYLPYSPEALALENVRKMIESKRLNADAAAQAARQ